MTRERYKLRPERQHENREGFPILVNPVGPSPFIVADEGSKSGICPD